MLDNRTCGQRTKKGNESHLDTYTFIHNIHLICKFQVATVGEKRCIHENVDYTSKDESSYEDDLGTWDYRQTTETSYQNCQKSCQVDWDCRFFTYVVEQKVRISPTVVFMG